MSQHFGYWQMGAVVKAAAKRTGQHNPNPVVSVETVFVRQTPKYFLCKTRHDKETWIEKIDGRFSCEVEGRVLTISGKLSDLKSRKIV